MGLLTVKHQGNQTASWIDDAPRYKINLFPDSEITGTEGEEILSKKGW